MKKDQTQHIIFIDHDFRKFLEKIISRFGVRIREKN
jgi:hypothetical protein